MALLGTAAVISGLNDSYDFVAKLRSSEGQQHVQTEPSETDYKVFLHLESDVISQMFARAVSFDDSTQLYASEQFKTYQETWYALQKLKLAADSLWVSANEENMANFIIELDSMRLSLANSQLFIDESHLRELNDLLFQFDAYGLGKVELARMYTAIGGRRELPKWDKSVQQRVRQRIDENGKTKERYERLLEGILNLFKAKLSGKSETRVRLEDQVRKAQDRVLKRLMENRT